VINKAPINHFTDLEAWKSSHELTLEIYRITKSFPSGERFGIVDQLRRASSSMTANVAEGWGRFHYLDRINFYYQAGGSGCEVQNFLILSRDLGYLPPTEFDKLNQINPLHPTAKKGIQMTSLFTIHHSLFTSDRRSPFTVRRAPRHSRFTIICIICSLFTILYSLYSLLAAPPPAYAAV
jgi:four helix bundle protein